MSTYPATMVAKARVHREAGWSLRRICSLLEEEFGRRPAVKTVACWVDDRVAERHRVDARKRQRRYTMGASSFRFPARSHDWKVERVRALVLDGGLGYEAAAKVMSFDFPDTPITRDQVCRIVNEGILPRVFREAV